MKRVSFGCLFTFALAVSLAAQATTTPKAAIGSDAEYATHMKEIGQLNGMLNKSLKGGDTGEAAKAASRLEVLFKNVHGYWNEKKVEDATMAAQTAVTALQGVQKAIAANDMAAAQTARASFAGTCMACHKEHREKLPEGGFRIK